MDNRESEEHANDYKRLLEDYMREYDTLETFHRKGKDTERMKLYNDLMNRFCDVDNQYYGEYDEKISKIKNRLYRWYMHGKRNVEPINYDINEIIKKAENRELPSDFKWFCRDYRRIKENLDNGKGFRVPGNCSELSRKILNYHFNEDDRKKYGTLVDFFKNMRDEIDDIKEDYEDEYYRYIEEHYNAEYIERECSLMADVLKRKREIEEQRKEIGKIYELTELEKLYPRALELERRNGDLIDDFYKYYHHGLILPGGNLERWVFENFPGISEEIENRINELKNN